MSVFQNLLEASYNGVPFLVPNETKSAGKKTADHDYPGSNKRYVEELGEMPGTYSISAIVHGANAIQRRISLENALKKQGRGLLVHPSLGQIYVVCTDYSSSSSDDSIGEFKFDITFKESLENITLQRFDNSSQFISSIADNLRSAIDNSFVLRFKNIKTPYILQETTNQILDVTSQIRSLASGLSNVTSANITTLNGVIDVVENISPILARNGANLISQVRDIYNAYENVSSNISNYYNGYINQTTYGSDRVAKPLTTTKRINEENNLKTFEDHTRLNSLIGSYESAVYSDFETETDLLNVTAALESAYDYIFTNSRDDGIVFDQSVRFLLNDLRVSSRKVFDQKRQNTWRVVDINPGETSMALTTYRYYGDLDNIDVMRELNKNINHAYIDETIKAVS